MKILRVMSTSLLEGNPQLEAVAADPKAPALPAVDVRLIADSAANRNDRPVFVPDYAREGWVMEILPAIHIGRLGKFISPRFARRYISGFSVVALLHRADESEANGLYDIFDGAITLGKVFGEIPERIEIKGVMTDLDDGSELSCDTAWIDGTDLLAEATVAVVSRFCTLKSGDIIIPGALRQQFPVELGTSLEVKVNGESALITRLK